MKKLLFAMLILANCGNISNTHENVNCSTGPMIQVREYDSLYSSNFVIKRTISDKDTIQRLIDLLEKLPDEGEIMIKWHSGASLHKAILIELPSKYDTVDIIEKKIKTLKTSFFNPTREEEREFVEILLGTK